MAASASFYVYRSSDGGISDDITSSSVYAQIFLESTNTTQLSNATLRVEYSTESFYDSDSTIKNIGSSFGVTSLLNIGVRKTVYIGSFSTSDKYYFTLHFNDGASSAAPVFGVVFGTDIPFVIAKNNFGVSIGGKPTGTAYSPMFDVYWPSNFSGGIESFGGAWTPLVLESGVEDGGRYGGGYLRARVIERRCIIKGSVNVTPQSGVMKLAKLPNTDYWPDVEDGAIFSINACQGHRIARIAAHGSADTYPGYLCLEWVWDLTNNERETDDKIWVQCSIEYWV